MSGKENILAKILAVKAGEVARAKETRPLAVVERACTNAPLPRGFGKALKRPDAAAPVRVIAEIKRASPSAGPIRPDAVPEDIARQYAGSGAAALSVLTDQQFFDGRLEFLSRVRQVVDVPLLRKDFLIDRYQVYEARAQGADAVLLIVAALAQESLVELLGITRDLGMDALVEVHSAEEARRAVDAGADIIGVNHRDLSTFTMDMSLTGTLRREVPPEITLVGESGIYTADDVRKLGEAGADAVLVGESLMRAESPGAALAALLGRTAV